MALTVKINADYQEFVAGMAAVKEFMSGVLQGMKQELHEQAEAAKEAMKQQTSVLEDTAQLIKARMSGITSAVEGVKIAWAQLAVIGEATHLMYEAATGTAHMAKEAGDLGAKLGTSATEASRLRVALQLNGVEVGEFTKATNGLNKTILAHEERLTSVGIATRDANGNLRSQVDLTIDAIAKLNEFKEGTDRNIEAQKLFGKGVQLSDEMLALTAEKLQEGAKFADAYGLTVGKEGVESSEAFIEATHRVGLILEGLKNAIGQALLPILSDLTKWLTENGPFAMNVIKIAIAEVTSIFYGLKFAGQVLYEALSMIFKNLMEIGGAFGRVMYDVLHGDFGAAAEDAKQAFATIQTNASQAFGNVMTDATATRDKLANMWGNIVAPKAVEDSGKAGHGTEDVEVNKKKGPKKKKSSDAAARRAAAEARKKAEEQYRAAMEGYKGEEQAAEHNYEKLKEVYSKELAAATKMYGEKSQQAQAVINKIEALERKHAEDMAKLDERKREADRMRALAEIDSEEIEARAKVDLGQMTEEQMFAAEADFERRRYQLRLTSLQDEAALNAKKPDQLAAINQRTEQLEQQHSLKMQGIAAQQRVAMQQPMMQMFQTIQQGFGQMITGLITRTTTFKQAMTQMGTQLLNQFVQQEMMKLGQVIRTQLGMTEATVGGNATRVASNLSANATTAASDGQTATKSLFASGAEVFGKVYKSIAGIPYVGPFLAPVMALAAMGAVVGMVSKVASARGGYDIPAGVNPVTQLHEEEMVLPSKYANAIRDMAENGPQRAPASQHYHISAVDSRSMKEALRRNQGGLGDAIRLAARNGYLKPG